MFSIHMDGQDKTKQIKDWYLWSRGNEIMVTATFPSGKKFTRPLDVCEIMPTSKIENGILEKKKEKNIYKLIDSAVSYGGKYLIVNYLNDSKNYIMKSGVSIKP